jgi:hypothetical protein
MNLTINQGHRLWKNFPDLKRFNPYVYPYLAVQETLDRMIGLQLFSPFVTSQEVDESSPHSLNLADIQADLGALGWPEGNVSGVEDLRDFAGETWKEKGAQKEDWRIGEEGLVQLGGQSSRADTVQGHTEEIPHAQERITTAPRAEHPPDPQTGHLETLTHSQVGMLESALAFGGPNYRPAKESYYALAKRTGLSPVLVEAWFERKRKEREESE